MSGRGRDGIALISGLIFLAITVVLVSVALMVSISNRRLSGDYVRTTEAQIAADAGLERAIYEVWFKPNLEGGDLPEDFQLTLEQFRTSLDAAGVLAASIGVASVGSGTGFSFGPLVTFEDSLESTSYTTSLRRVDVGDKYTLLRLDSLGRVGDVATRRVTEDLIIGIPEHDASQFALLSNQANCIFCHTQITSLEVGYTADGGLAQLDNLTAQERMTVFKNKTRIRIGVLEKLQSDRLGEIDSLIAGTLYSRGETNLFSSNSTLYGVPFSTIDGHTTSRLSADEHELLSSATNCGSGCSERLQQAYRNYPVQGPDGELPEVFPSLIEDGNGNRVIEHNEWREAIAAEDVLGKLKGGSKKRVDTTVSGTDTLVADRATGLRSITTLSSLESSDGVQGNLVLEGTSSSPLIIEDTLYVNGDVIIQGPITGDGKIVARGNIYLAGNVTYACDNDSRDFTYASADRVPCNYAQPDSLPRLGLIAGKNILLGNYMMPGLASTSGPEDHLTRKDFSSTSPEELAQWFIDAGQALTPEASLSYSMIQAALFNQSEYDKARGDSSYIPRFYQMREDSPVWLCEQGFSQDKNDYCKSYSELTNLALSTNSQDEAILARASFLSLTPGDSWLAPLDDLQPNQSSELFVRKTWVDAVETNNTQESLRIDGVLFSSNAIFGLLPETSKTSGKALLNGSLIVADTALLPSKGLRIHYDERLSELIDPSTVQIVVQTRNNYRLLKIGEQVDYSDVGY